MEDVGLTLVVVRSHRLDDVRKFYEAIGLVFAEEQHGSGPPHLAATLASGGVFELYPAVAGEGVERGSTGDVRLGFCVTDVASVVSSVTAGGGTVVSDVTTRGDGLAAVVADPEGRRVEITSAAG